MVFFNHATRQMTAKIVYYGPGLCGKTTNLSTIYERTSQKARGEMVSLNTETDRTLFFDLLPMDVGVIGGFKAKLQLYTVPGQVFYNSTRKLVLKGVDGIVFVADSQVPMLNANRESLQNLAENLKELGLKLRDIPMVFQWNKRDLKHILPIEVLERELNPWQLNSFQAVARDGTGVFETLRGISRLGLAQIKRLHLADPSAPQPPSPRPEVPPAAGDWASPQGTRPLPAAPAGALPEALSFLDLPAGGDLFASGRPAQAPAGGPAPVPARPLPSQPTRPGPAPLPNGVPRMLLKPLPALTMPRVPTVAKAAQLLTRPGPQAPVRQAPLLRLALPAEAQDGDLELQVLIRRNGVVVAEASAPLAGPASPDPETLAIELKRL